MKRLTKKQHEALGHALYCTDPRHETPCPQPCVGCDCDGCDTKYLKWFDMDNKLVSGKPLKVVGGKYRFTYPNYGTPDGHPDYTAHSGQQVTIERQLTNKECHPECQPMWKIRAKDGWTGSAHSTELRTPSKPKVRKQKKVFVCCRWGKRNVPIFYAVCSTMDIAQRQVDKLTMRFGPTFLIIDAPLDP